MSFSVSTTLSQRPAKLPGPFYEQQNRDEGNRSQKTIHCRKPQYPVRNKNYKSTGCALGQGDVKL
jgi:hypothetical protein